MPIIEIQHVTKEFRLGQGRSAANTLRNFADRLRGRQVPEASPFKALDDVHFSVEEGEVLGIIGHNGAGKSTLLKMLAGITRPTSGTVSVHGRVAPLIEVGAGLVPDLTGRENIVLNATMLGMKRADLKRNFDSIVDFAELHQFIDTPVKRYSTGMQVRLGFAIATAVESDILIVDEVLAVGDIAFQRKCYERLDELTAHQHRTLVFVSHNLRQVERFCSRVLLIDSGRVIFDGPSHEACNRYTEATDGKLASMHRQAFVQSTGEVELLSIGFLDDAGNELDEIALRRPAVLRADVRVKQTLREPGFTFGIQTGDGFFASVLGSENQLRMASLAPGLYRLSCRVMSIPLSPGCYGLFFSVECGKATAKIYHGEYLKSFVIRQPNPASLTATERIGFCVLDALWQHPTVLSATRKSNEAVS